MIFKDKCDNREGATCCMWLAESDWWLALSDHLKSSGLQIETSKQGDREKEGNNLINWLCGDKKPFKQWRVSARRRIQSAYLRRNILKGSPLPSWLRKAFVKLLLAETLDLVRRYEGTQDAVTEDTICDMNLVVLTKQTSRCMFDKKFFCLEVAKQIRVRFILSEY